MVLVLAPSADKVSGEAVSTIVLTAPALNVTVTVLDTPPQVAVMVADPTMVELVNVTVATPFVVVALTAESVPAVVVKLTVVPSNTLLPLAFLTVAEINVVDAPSATMLDEPAVTVTVPTVAAIIVMVSFPVLALVDVAVTVSVPPPGTVLGAV